MPAFHFDPRHLEDASDLEAMVNSTSVALQSPDDAGRTARRDMQRGTGRSARPGARGAQHFADLPDECCATPT